MLPKSYLVAKWSVYGLATLLLILLQQLLLCRIRLWGVTPFIYPLLPAVVSCCEGRRQGSVFALVFGILCDLLLPGPFEGFFAIAFTLSALLAGFLGERLLSRGLLCFLAAGALALLLTGLGRILLLPPRHMLAAVRILLVETALSMPALLAVCPLYGWINYRCRTDY